MKNRNYRGKISYIGSDGNERGREWFSVTRHPDGQRTLRAVCEIDDSEITRDVTYTTDENYLPLDCFNRLHRDGKFLGTGWIRITDTYAECEVFNTELGRVRQKMPLEQPATSLGSHPLTCDVMHLPAFDQSKPDERQHLNRILMTSPLPHGGSGPLISKSSVYAEYLGEEEVVVPAGTFMAHHYRYPLSPNPDGTPRQEDVWCLHDDWQFVKVTVTGFLKDSSYVLTEYEEDD